MGGVKLKREKREIYKRRDFHNIYHVDYIVKDHDACINFGKNH